MRIKLEKPWTVGEEQKLARMAATGVGADAIAASLDRPVGSVQNKARRLRVSLRRRGETRGKVLGEPNAGSWAHARGLKELRKEIAEGRVDAGELERFAMATVKGAPLCPDCSLRPIDTPAGFCRPCYARRILEAYRDTTAHREAERALAAARSERRRRRQDATRRRR